MSIDVPTYFETRRKFLANRAAFPVEEMAKYAGLWVVWSPDGSRVAASAVDPALLDNLLRDRREDRGQCVIPGDEALFGQADGTAA